MSVTSAKRSGKLRSCQSSWAARLRPSGRTGEQVRSKAGRNRLKVEVGDDGTGAALQERVTRSLNNEFKSLATPPAVSVKLLPNATAANTAANAATNTAANPATAPVAPEVQR